MLSLASLTLGLPTGPLTLIHIKGTLNDLPGPGGTLTFTPQLLGLKQSSSTHQPITDIIDTRLVRLYYVPGSIPGY